MRRDISLLKSMLSYCRPHKTRTEEDFIARFITPLDVMADPFGNLFKIIGDDPDTLWSCHTDTVHTRTGRQRVLYDSKSQLLFLDAGQNSGCLGADCTAGVFIMTEMIKANVPGLYVFHRGEEKGMLGANYIVNKTKLLDGIKKAIAFDRMGHTSIITYQCGSRTASDAFANSMIEQLPGYVIDTGGVFTDTQAYADVVEECTNISVGYARQHTEFETQHVGTLLKLRDAMVKIDASKFVVARDPSKIDSLYSQPKSYRDKYGLYSEGTIRSLVYYYPDAIEKILLKFGVTYDALAAAVREQVDITRANAEAAFTKKANQPTPNLPAVIEQAGLMAGEEEIDDDRLEAWFPSQQQPDKSHHDPVQDSGPGNLKDDIEPTLGQHYEKF